MCLVYEDECLRYLSEAQAYINMFQDIDAYDAIFEAEEADVDAKIIENKKSNDGAFASLKKAAESLMNLIKNAMKTIVGGIEKLFASKSEKEAFEQFKKAAENDPKLKNKKINMSLISNKKTITCHVVANTETEIFKTLETISNSIVTDFKIPYNREDKTFMTLDDKSDSPCLDINKYSDPYVKGQLKIRLSRILKINKTGNTITSIKRSDFYLQ